VTPPNLCNGPLLASAATIAQWRTKRPDLWRDIYRMFEATGDYEVDIIANNAVIGLVLSL
jgi:hypothetical protein